MKREVKHAGVFTRRALLIGGAQAGLLGLLGARLYQTQITDGARYETLSDKNRVSARLVAPPRGRVLDRFGTVVAGNKLNWRALLLAEQAGDVDATLDAFGRTVLLDDRDRARVERELRVRRRFIPVIVREFLSWEEMARIEVNAPDLPGILVDLGATRLYPFGPVLAHVVGYVAPPNEADVKEDAMLALPGIRVGRNGMEKAQELPLRGKAGAVQMEVNAVGRVIRELDREEGTPGLDLGLTLDADLQQKVLARLGDESASAVVLDARNGEVLAMGTNPSFDPSLFNSGVSEAQWVAWTSNRRSPLINKAVAGLYAPGSTFKMAVAMAGLDSGALRPGEYLNCPGYIDVGDTRFHCWRKGGHGALDARGALMHSCDVFFYQAALKTGIDRIAAMANRFGIGVDLGIELPGAKHGLMPTRAWRRSHGHPWQIGDTVSCGIGQGYIQTTPLALATYCARIATGRAVEPHLTRTLGGAMQPGVHAADWPSLGVNEHHLQSCRQGMWAVVNAPGGTAPQARLKLPGGVQLAGKTGSTQVRRVSRAARESGHYHSENLPWEFRPHALFVCYAPYDQPRYAVSVVVEHGNAGAAAAAPLARGIMEDTLMRDPAGKVSPAQRVAEIGASR